MSLLETKPSISAGLRLTAAPRSFVEILTLLWSFAHDGLPQHENVKYRANDNSWLYFFGVFGFKFKGSDLCKCLALAKEGEEVI